MADGLDVLTVNASLLHIYFEGCNAPEVNRLLQRNYNALCSAQRDTVFHCVQTVSRKRLGALALLPARNCSHYCSSHLGKPGTEGVASTLTKSQKILKSKK
jgi:hypothetical protein